MVSIHSTEQLGDIIREAASRNSPVYPVAGRTHDHLLAPADDKGVSVDLTGLNQLIDYPHRDLTITVQAGMTLKALQKLLQAHNQTLPIDVPHPATATVGGSIAANINGPRRTGWGTWRDYLIGLSWMNDQGQKAKAGGRVVKNVAGYDFCKLFTGSLGTLGIITQVTLKVKPRPEKCCLATCSVKRDELGALNELMRYSRLRPTVFVAKSEQQSTWPIRIAFEDSQTTVDWQIAHLRMIGQSIFSDIEVKEDIEAEKEIGDLTEFRIAGEGITLQIQVPGSRCVGFVTQAQPVLPQLQVQPAIGKIVGHLSPQATLEDTNRVIKTLRDLAESMGGHVMVSRCPPEWRTTLQPWGPPRGDWSLMRKVKQAMDPNNIFQRGRHEILESSS